MAQVSSLKLKSRTVCVLCAAALVAVGCLTVMLVTAKRALFVEGGSREADVIVVLGGDPGDRVFRALELYRAGAAPRILVSGDGDCYMVRDRFVLAGVGADSLILEPNSRNTKENAELSVRIIREHRWKKAIVVTSWYHSRRALACFGHFGKDIQWSSYPAYHGLTMDHKPGAYEIPHVFREFSAMGWYMVRYGILPSSRLSTFASRS